MMTAWMMLVVALSGFSGALRVRGESRNTWNRSPVFLRTRINWTWEHSRTRLFFQVQDSRQMGEEWNTLADGSADQMDLHQGYLEVRGEKIPWLLRVGRMEVRYANERLLGAVGWHNIGRSLDGGVFHYGAKNWVDLFGFLLRDTDTLRSRLGGVWAKHGPFQMFAILENREAQSTWNRFTLGGMGRAEWEAVQFSGEVAYQGGEWGQRVSAYMITLALERVFGWGKGKMAVDLLSGDDPSTPDVSEVFHTLYPTNHKFYGFMDFFLNIPRDTEGRGLVDAYVTFQRSGHAGMFPLSFRLDLHHFRAHQGGGVWGNEVDLTLKSRLDRASVQVGASAMFPGELGASRWGEGVHWWTYAMVTVVFRSSGEKTFPEG